jgi:hypothetical protein
MAVQQIESIEDRGRQGGRRLQAADPRFGAPMMDTLGTAPESSSDGRALTTGDSSAVAAPDAASRPSSGRLADGARKLAASAVILFVLYVNVAIIFNYPLAKFAAGFSLPMTWQIYDCFQIFGVFSSYEMLNRDVEVYGITAPTKSMPEGKIVRLDLAEYFPFGHGESQGRATVARHLYNFGPVGQYDAYQSLAKKIRARYARLHPEIPIEKIVIVQVAWRRNLEGFELMKLNENLSILFSE